MTLDDLEKAFDAEFSKHRNFRREGKIAGIAAVVSALRDETVNVLWDVAKKECCGKGTANRFSEQLECCDCPDLLVTTEQINNVFNEILGEQS